MKNSLKNKYKTKTLKSHKGNGMSGAESKFTPVQMNEALIDSFDLMQRFLLDNVYLVLGEAAKCIKESKDITCNKLEFGIEKKHIIPEVKSLLTEWIKG